jgi:ribonuclease VapC
MIIDSSALLAILGDEPERHIFNRSIIGSQYRGMSVAVFIEASIGLESRHGYDGIRDLDLFIVKAEIDLVPVDIEQAYIARRAYKQFGKGKHPAGLNFGDCFSYALAKARNDSLLFKGTDFSKTDIEIYEY